MSGILVIVEQSGGVPQRIGLEALSAGHALGAALGQPVRACVFGAQAAAAARTLGGLPVIALEHERLEAYTADGATAALAELIAAEAPDYVVLPHSYQVRDYGPKLATRLGRVLVSDCTGIVCDAGPVRFERQLFQGKLTGTFEAGPAPVLVSVQAGAYRIEAVPGEATVELRRPALDAAQIRQRPEPPFRETAKAVDLSTASAIVAVGRGIGEEGNLVLVEELAAALGAELGASRPICDNGWVGMERQVGSSGQTVAPKLYVAVGISGAIQHLVGMKGSECIVAINKDPNAPIFEVADYGIAGDLFEVVPALTAELSKAKG